AAPSPATAGVLPGGAGVRLQAPVAPAPKAAADRLVGLHQKPIATNAKADRKVDADREARPAAEGLIRPCRNQSSRQVAAAVCVEADVDRARQTITVEVIALDIEAVDHPARPGRDNEVISGLIIERIV